MLGRLRHPLVAMAAVVALTVPWVAVRGLGFVSALPVAGVIAVSGVAVIGAAFVLTWGAETAAVDVPRSFALAILATGAIMAGATPMSSLAGIADEP